MDWEGEIVKNPGVLFDKPRIKDTRISMETIPELTACFIP